MKRNARTPDWARITACALIALAGTVAAAGEEEVVRGTEAVVGTLPEAPIFLAPAVPDPARRARLVEWWRHFEAARPALSVVGVRLRGERDRWREGSTRDGCRTARRALAELDSAALRRAVDYMLTLEIGQALDEFDAAAVACLERRYFEFDYRLQVAEAALAAARRRAAAQLARPVE